MCQFNCDVSIVKDREILVVMDDVFVSSCLSCHAKFLQCTDTDIKKKTSWERLQFRFDPNKSKTCTFWYIIKTIFVLKIECWSFVLRPISGPSCVNELRNYRQTQRTVDRKWPNWACLEWAPCLLMNKLSWASSEQEHRKWAQVIISSAVQYADSYLPRWWISIICTIPVLRNHRKCRYIFMFPKIGLAQQA